MSSCILQSGKVHATIAAVGGKRNGKQITQRRTGKMAITKRAGGNVEQAEAAIRAALGCSHVFLSIGHRFASNGESDAWERAAEAATEAGIRVADVYPQWFADCLNSESEWEQRNIPTFATMRARAFRSLLHSRPHWPQRAEATIRAIWE
jgi:hypothetical protein